MEEQMKLILGVLFIVVFFAFFGLNAMFMLISPRAWFRLPHWLRLSGGLTKSEYGSGWGAVQIRLVGGCFFAVIIYFLWVAATSKH
jgi:hypothetical protein